MKAPTKTTSAPLIPQNPTLESLRRAAAGCRACDLWERGTQTIFGEGKSRAALLLVGEQPGDVEDVQGRPFVGPAGKLLDAALKAAGIDRTQVYVTNAVKHFNWEPKGKRRIHKKPGARHIAACKPWLRAEVEAINPRVVVCLGATAAQALLGPAFRVTQHRGEALHSDVAPGSTIVATVHPSSLLRVNDAGERDLAMDAFVTDLRHAAALL
jgi:uracil-DNA glycosylase